MSATSQPKRVYLDTSFLVSLFLNELRSQAAEQWIIGEQPLVVLSPLNLLEFENALNLRIFFGSIDNAQASHVRNDFRQKLKSELYTVASESTEVWEQASKLSLIHSPTLGTRSLDIWHVAFAIVLETRVFGSFDERQRKLASQVGLVVNGI